MTHVEDPSEDTPHPFPRTATAQLREKYVSEPLFTYGPADEEALAQREARVNAATQAAQAVEQAILNAGPGEAVQVPNEYIDQILAQRNTIHGDFSDDATTAQALKYIMRKGNNWDDMPPFAREALDQMQTKIGRILAGDWRHPDHWKDLQGYPRLVELRL